MGAYTRVGKRTATADVLCTRDVTYSVHVTYPYALSSIFGMRWYTFVISSCKQRIGQVHSRKRDNFKTIFAS